MKWIFISLILGLLDISRCERLNYFRQTSIVFAIASQETPLENTCQRELKEIKNAVLRKDIWAMKVLDSSAHKNPGFILGNGFWLGSIQGCATTQSPLKISLTKRIKRSMKEDLINDVAPFETEYKVVHLKSNSPWQIDFKVKAEPILHLGLCLPKSCSNEEVFNMTSKSIGNGLIEDFNLLEFQPEVLRVKDLKLSRSFFTRTSLVLFLLITLLTLSMYSKANVSSSFDLKSHIKTLFTIRENKTSSIPVIDGYKTTLCFSLVVVHVMFYSFYTMNNKGSFLAYFESAAFQLLAQAPVFVEGFFVISAFLSCHNFLSNKNGIEEIRKASFFGCIVKYFKMVLQRYFRLVPLYAVFLLITDFTTAYSNEVSPFSLEERYDEMCPKYWWRHLLFIQNFFDYKEICMSWSWSTACDMQFFVVVSAILFVYARNQTAGKCLMLFSWIFSLLWFIVTALKFQYGFSVDIMNETITQVYMNPFYRFAPYFFGTIAAWILNNHKHFLLKMNPEIEEKIWKAIPILFVLIIFMEIDRSLSTIPTVLIAILGQASNAFLVCWIILASATGKTSWWSRILENPVFQHFSKLTYGIYLINSVITAFIFSLSENSTNSDIPLLLFISLGCMILSYLLTIGLHVLYEAPYLKLTKVLFHEKRKVL
ncbi:hypothetical protein ACFFRR_007694 [Megaselia abdita]